MPFPEWPQNNGNSSARDSKALANQHGSGHDDPKDVAIQLPSLLQQGKHQASANGRHSLGTAFPETFADLDVRSSKSSERPKLAAPRLNQTLSSNVKPRTFSPKPREVPTPDSQPLPPTPSPAHHVPNLRQGFALLHSASVKSANTSGRFNFDSLARGTKLDSPNKVLHTPARPALGESVSASKQRLHSTDKGQGKSIINMPPPVSLSRGSRLASFDRSPIRNGAGANDPETPIRAFKSIPQLRNPISVPQKAVIGQVQRENDVEGDVSADDSLLLRPGVHRPSSALAFNRADSGNGLGPLVGPPEQLKDLAGKSRIGILTLADESTEASPRQTNQTPSKRQKFTHATTSASGHEVSVLDIAEQMSPDRLGLQNRDRVVRDGLAARAAAVLKRERSEWVLWEHTHCFALDSPAKFTAIGGAKGVGATSAEKAKARSMTSRAQRPEKLWEVIRVLTPAHGSGEPMLGARQILTLCREKHRGEENQADAIPVLFSTSVMHFNTGVTSRRAAQRLDPGRSGSSESRAIEEVMRRLAKLSLQGPQQRQQRQQLDQEALVIEAWDSMELSLLSAIKEAAPDNMNEGTALPDEGSEDKPHIAWLCTRFRIHQPTTPEQEQADQTEPEAHTG